jgi:hypothetical protein
MSENPDQTPMREATEEPKKCKTCGEMNPEKLVPKTKVCRKCKYKSQKEYLKKYYADHLDHYKELQRDLYQNFYKHNPKYVKTGIPCGRKKRPVPPPSPTE